MSLREFGELSEDEQVFHLNAYVEHRRRNPGVCPLMSIGKKHGRSK